MVLTFAALVSFACPSPMAIRSDVNGVKKVIKIQAERVQAATLKGDYETLIDFTYPRIVELAGGKEKAVEATRKAMKSFKEMGAEFVSATAGDPSEPIAAGTNLYSVIPTNTVMLVKGKKLNSEGYMIGVSSDKGKNWRFVHGSVDTEKVRKLLPDLPKSLKIPKRVITQVKD